MESIFEKLWRLGPAAFVMKAIVVVIWRMGAVGFILIARSYRKWYSRSATRTSSNLRPHWDGDFRRASLETWRQIYLPTGGSSNHSR